MMETMETMEPGKAAPEPGSFEAMGLGPDVVGALYEMGFVRPMAVQTAVFQPIMDGKDLLVQSKTGSGKTAAFGIPFAEKLVTADLPAPQALILEPTRELALQVAHELQRICARSKLRVTPIYGGAPMGRQIEELKQGVHVIAGTPGRVLDHLRRGTLHLDALRVLVLDECDEMLSMGFQEEIEAIIQRTPASRQTLLFSATIPAGIERLARGYMRAPEKISLSQDFVGVEQIKHVYYLVSGLHRSADLVRILEYEAPEWAIVFCNTRDETGQVAAYLQRHGFDAEAISGDLNQSERERVMARMRDRNLRILVATDIAARGIDIADLSHVINYSFPESSEVYIHRTGRTGRAGKEGVAISLISPRELGNFYYVKLAYKIRPEERELPSDEEMRARREGERYEALRQLVAEDVDDELRSLARRVWQSADGERLIAALLGRALKGGQPAGAKAEAAPPTKVEVAAVEEPRGAAPGTEAREVAPGAEPRGAEPRRVRFAEAAAHVEAGRPHERPARGRRRGRGPAEREAEARPDTGTGIEAASSERELESAETAMQPREEAPGVENAEGEGGQRKRRRRGGRGRRRPGRGGEATGGVQGAEGTASAGPRDEAPIEAPAALPPVVTEGRRGRGRRSDAQGDLRDFWETWVDARNAPPGESPVAAEAAAPASASEPRAGDRPDPVDEPGRTRLFVNAGRRDSAGAGDMEAFLAEKAGLPPDDLRLEVRGTYTYVWVASERVDEVIARVHGQAMGERQLVCERARR